MKRLEEKLLEKKRAVEETYSRHKDTKKEWISRVDKLYVKILKWLAPYKEKELLNVTKSPILIREELLGEYEIDKVIITFPNPYDTVEIVPIGRHVIGGNGRLDIKIGLRDVMLIGKDDGAWMFAERLRDGTRVTWEFNKETFEELLADAADTSW